MKFLLSGNLFQKRGPRRVLLLSMLLLMVGMLLHAARYTMDLQERRALRAELSVAAPPAEAGDPPLEADDLPASVSGLFYEDLHIDLFLFALFYLVLASVWLQAPAGTPAWLSMLFRHAPPLALLLFVLSRQLAMYACVPLALEALCAGIFYSVFFFDSLVLLWFLGRPGPAVVSGKSAVQGSSSGGSV